MNRTHRRGLLAVIASALAANAFADGELQIASLGQCELESGQVIEDCRLGYRTFGTLNDARSNVILFPTWYTGTTGDYVEFGFIAPGGFADSSRFYVVTVDSFSNGISSSPSNSPSQSGTSFPNVSIADMVDGQFRLLTKHLGIDHLHAVIGISMGGMQAFEWAVRYPEFPDYVVPVIGTPVQTSYDKLLWETQLETIRNFADDDYEGAVRIIAGLDNLNSHTPGYVASNTPLQNYDEYMAESVAKTDAYGLEDRVPQLQAMLGHDISKAFGGSMADAAAAIQASVLIVVSPADHMVNPQPSRNFAQLGGIAIRELQGDCGHLAVACEKDDVARIVNEFLPDAE